MVKSQRNFILRTEKKGAVSAALETVEGNNAPSPICQLALTYKKSLLPKSYDFVDGFYKLCHNFRVSVVLLYVYLTV
jgi:hypothetical protein